LLFSPEVRVCRVAYGADIEDMGRLVQCGLSKCLLTRQHPPETTHYMHLLKCSVLALEERQKQLVELCERQVRLSAAEASLSWLPGH